MLVTVVSWICITAVTCAGGLVLSSTVSRLFHYRIRTFSGTIMLGIAGATVYAEAFSLFYKIGALALLILSGLCVIGAVVGRKEIRYIIREWIDRIRSQRRPVLICLTLIGLSVVFLASYLSSRTPTGYDEYNYHLQSIRWLEEYGVVKGLGNLHTRFGYNSAFLCLQALFSFVWILRISLHSMNGYLWTFMMIWCTTSLCWFRKRSFGLSDLLKILCVLFLFRYNEMLGISGPNTDFFPVCITAFIFIRWCRLIEEQEKNAVPYGLLAMLGLFGASVKLSVGILFLFAIKPIIQCVREKQYATILKFFLIGILTVVPFLARNVMITGYLLYPMAAIDLFNVDWKIPRSVVVSDNVIIKLFARSTGSDYQYTYWIRPFTEWFKIWVQTAEDGYNVLGIVDLPLAVLVFLKGLYDKIRRRNTDKYLSVLLMAAVGIVFLFVTAPSTRFGRWWFFALPVILLYILIRSGKEKETVQEWSPKSVAAFSVTFMLLCTGFCTAIAWKQGHIITDYMIAPSNYEMNGTDGQYRMIDGIKHYFYTPNSNGLNSLNGYDGFPGTEVLQTLARIEMRSDDLKDGYRPKDAYKEIAYDFQGRILSPDDIRAVGLSKYYDADLMADYEDWGYYELLYSKLLDIKPEEYMVVSGKLKYAVDYEREEEKEVYCVSGWAYIDGDQEPDRETKVICLETIDGFYMGYPVKRKKIARNEGLDHSEIGFVIYTPEKLQGEIRIVDLKNKVIYR